MLLGRYENFPENVHSLAFFSYQSPAKSLQQAILCAFHRLNSETFDLVAVTPYLKRNCNVGFEFGIADGFDFNFLDQTELEKSLKAVDEKQLRVLDFFFAIRYHETRKGSRKVPLRFDYLIIRFVFHEDQLEARIRHEKGTQRVPLDELTGFVVNQINVELCRAQLNPLLLNEKNKISIEFSD